MVAGLDRPYGWCYTLDKDDVRTRYGKFMRFGYQRTPSADNMEGADPWRRNGFCMS